ncbi:uncharacterized protein LOC128551396, partial [Mercenaria mercenaria]|uniref:uncharacterized protein LOC128551396 n=1 Tax=Mercenaria mercenaria TaxID=6596 RepID=UPI00234EB8CF
LVNTDLCCEYKGTEYMHLVKMTLEMKVTALSFDISIGKIADAENVCLDTLMKDTKNLLELVEELISEEESDEVTTLKSENESLKSEVMRLQRETELLKKQGCSSKPVATEVEMESVTLSWDQSSDLRDTDYYQVHYKEETDCEWSIHPEKYRSTTAVLANLKPGATYIFRIKTVSETENVYSFESDAIVTLHSQAALLLEEAEKLEDFSFAIYLLPVTEVTKNDKTKIMKYLVDAGNKQEQKCRIDCEWPFEFGEDDRDELDIALESMLSGMDERQLSPFDKVIYSRGNTEERKYRNIYELPLHFRADDQDQQDSELETAFHQ